MWLEIDAEIDVHLYISLPSRRSIHIARRSNLLVHPQIQIIKALEQQIAMAAEDNFEDVPSGEEEEEETTLKSR